METSAKISQLRIAPRKVRLVSDYLKGMDVTKAKNQLDHLAKRAAKPLSKLLDSAIANANNNLGMVKENLYIKNIVVDEGTKLKRFRPKGFGSTSPIEKKTSQVKIVLDERVQGMKAEPKKKIEREESREEKAAKPMAEKKTIERIKPEIKKETPKRGFFGKLGKRFFRRKAI